MQHTHDAVASRRGGALRWAILASGLLAGSSLPAFAESAHGGSEGIASFYGRPEHGGPTASGERFNMHAMTAAHRTAPLGSRLKVTNLRNGRSIVVRINDRGPFVRGRIIDLSHAAAAELDFIGSGLTRVHVETADAGTPTETPTRLAKVDTIETGSIPAPKKHAKAQAHAKKPASNEVTVAVIDERDRLLIERNGVAN